MTRNLQTLREARGLSRAQLSYLARAYPTLVGQIELGRLTPRSDSIVLVRLGEALGYEGDPGELLDEVNVHGA